jgi:hypothetical protein
LSKKLFRCTVIYKSGQLNGTPEYIQQLADVYYRGLMEVGTIIEDYLAYEKAEGKDE